MILAVTPGDAGAYYAQAVNERNGENKTSPPIHLSVARESRGPRRRLSSEVATDEWSLSHGAARNESHLPGWRSRFNVDPRSMVAFFEVTGRNCERN